jgi:hypothetical protein
MTKNKHVAATHSMKEALWLHSLLSEVFSTITSPTTLFSDNQAVIAPICDHQYHAWIKNIDVQNHLICWEIKQGSPCPIYYLTNDMVTDTLTKASPLVKVKHFMAELRLHMK